VPRPILAALGRGIKPLSIVSAGPRGSSSTGVKPSPNVVELLASYSNTAPQVAELVSRAYEVAGQASDADVMV
jgi:hypothetical protein